MFHHRMESVKATRRGQATHAASLELSCAGSSSVEISSSKEADDQAKVLGGTAAKLFGFAS